jgi:hypothetical protein
LGGGTRLDLQFACKTFAAALILPNGGGALALLGVDLHEQTVRRLPQRIEQHKAVRQRDGRIRFAFPEQILGAR